MSTGTPGPSQSPVQEAPTPNATQDVVQAADTDRLVLEYLKVRGYKAAEEALSELMDDDTSESNKASGSTTVSADELISKVAVFASKPSRPGENVFKSTPSVLEGLMGMNNPTTIHDLIASLGAIGAEDILVSDPTDKHGGYRELETWVEGSLDMYQPELRPVLFPIFCHFYLDLIQAGYKDAGRSFYNHFSPQLMTSHRPTLHHLSTLTLPAHVQNDDLAQRFKSEKYVVKMSRSGLSLLIGWLTEGSSGEGTGAGIGFSGETGKRGRSATLGVVNNHLRFDVTTANSTAVTPNSWEESTGLLSSLIPQNKSATTTLVDPRAFNASAGQLKLGPAPLSEDFQTAIKEQAMMDRELSTSYDFNYNIQPTVPGTIAPTTTELLPHPPTFKTLDVRREVERVRDERKRIRLEPSTLTAVGVNSPAAATYRASALPSVCIYTLHDVPEGAPCVEFSPDVSMMAAGFAESYIRLWSLKGEKLRGMRSDFQPSSVKDAASLRKLKEKAGTTTRKLIGHSGPVYSLSFDPLNGSAASPRHLLSSSADGTARLWSLDTMTNLVAYRGHQNPVWDVKWSPMGVYFATASRDRTARLWSTDRTTALRIYAGHLSDVDCLDFHPNSLYLASGSSDWTARLWDVQRGACVRVFIGHQGGISTLAVSPDGRYLASAGEDLAINVWDLGSGKRIKKMTGHKASIYSLSFSAESSLLVSGSADWTMKCWDVKGTGGAPNKQQNGAAVNGFSSTDTNKDEVDSSETTDLLASFPTKRTPIIKVEFTPRNLCLAAGPYLSPDQR
ncbi:TFIID and SAGA subunit [Thelephora terrestris]|uniref:TFIID and SAGA subunit n=1 Tax=Thelephora terrestris TaxID=56493 RepID=A0A9P6L8J8_9AGAM|nr:TFIID and SAGA subunit [Thelephora terrestris]